MEKLEVLTEQKERIDKYLSENLDYSRSKVQNLLNKEKILVNDKIVTPSYKVNYKDIITIIDDEEETTDILPENIPLDIVYEDEDVILINKPSGMVVHPGSGNWHQTMVNALMYYTKNLSSCNGKVRPGIVHRIDKDTSGLILVAKNDKAHEILADDFAHKRVKRTYIALVKGVLKHNHITIDAPIGRDKTNRQKMCVTAENSKDAVTHLTVLKRYHDYTLVKCNLETGRTHQIRVHLAYIGYPVYNDPVYNKNKATSFGQFLHSSEIEFVSPITKKEVHLSVPLPKEFQAFLNELAEETVEEERK